MIQHQFLVLDHAILGFLLRIEAFMSSFKNNILTALIVCMSLATVFAYAHEGHEPNEGPARIEALSPLQGDIIRSLEFTLFVKIEGDPAGDLVDLDHIHYGVDLVGGNAIDTAETTPNLSGTTDILLPFDAADGEYELCLKLARVDHSLIGEKSCISFFLVTSGFDLISPSDNETINSFDIDFSLAQFGEADIDQIHYTVNGGEEVIVDNLDALFLITGLNSGLVQGENSIVIWGTSNATQVGYTIELTVLIDSKLNLENASKLAKLLRKYKHRKSIRLLKKSRRLIRAMQTGGSQHPDLVNLNSSNLAKIDRSLKKILKSDSDFVLRLAKKSLRVARSLSN